MVVEVAAVVAEVVAATAAVAEAVAAAAVVAAAEVAETAAAAAVSVQPQPPLKWYRLAVVERLLLTVPPPRSPPSPPPLYLHQPRSYIAIIQRPNHSLPSTVSYICYTTLHHSLPFYCIIHLVLYISYTTLHHSLPSTVSYTSIIQPPIIY